MTRLSKILQRGLQTKLADLVSFFGDILLLVLVGVVCVGFQACLIALLRCERVDSEVVQLEDL